MFEIVEMHAFPLDPACMLICKGGKLGGDAIFRREPMPHDFELERPDRAENGVAGEALPIEEQLHGAFLGELREPFGQLLAPEGIRQAYTNEVFGRKTGDPGNSTGGPSQIVSPMRNTPLSHSPITSPETASSISVRSWAMN